MRTLRTYTLIYWLLGVALLFATVGGPDHLHLCLDGQEKAVAFHAPDGDLHHLDEVSGHRDEDIDLPETGFAKSFSKSFLQPALVLAVTFLLFWPASGTPRPVRVLSEPLALLARHLIPPLRGPPLLNLR